MFATPVPSTHFKHWVWNLLVWESVQNHEQRLANACPRSPWVSHRPVATKGILRTAAASVDAAICSTSPAPSATFTSELTSPRDLFLEGPHNDRGCNKSFHATFVLLLLLLLPLLCIDWFLSWVSHLRPVRSATPARASKSRWTPVLTCTFWPLRDMGSSPRAEKCMPMYDAF